MSPGSNKSLKLVLEKSVNATNWVKHSILDGLYNTNVSLWRPEEKHTITKMTCNVWFHIVYEESTPSDSECIDAVSLPLSLSLNTQYTFVELVLIS